jgi:hypothetical protein
MRQHEPRNPTGVRTRSSNSFTIDSQGNNVSVNSSSSPVNDGVDKKPLPMTPAGDFFKKLSSFLI